MGISKFSIETTFALFWPAFRKSLGLILLTAVILYAAYLPVWMLLGLIHYATGAPPLVTYASDIIQALFGYLILAAHTCAATEIVLARIADRPVTLGGALRKGVVWALPAFVIGLLWLLGVMLGWVLLLIPGLIFASVFAVPLPALIAEKTGIPGAFGRARALTKGHRWGIFGLSLIVNLSVGFLIAAALVIVGVTTDLAGINQPDILKGGLIGSVVAVAIFLLVAFVLYALMLVPVVMNVCTYATLRADKGEALTGSVAKIFE